MSYDDLQVVGDVIDRKNKFQGRAIALLAKDRSIIRIATETLDQELALHLLSYYGEDQAQAMRNKSKARITAYLKSKLPYMKMDAFIEDEELADVFIADLTNSLFRKAGKNAHSQKMQAKGSRPTILFAASAVYASAARALLENNETRNFMLLMLCLVTDPSVPYVLESDEEEAFLRDMASDNPSSAHRVLARVEAIVRNPLLRLADEAEVLEFDYAELGEKFVSAGSALIDSEDFPPESLFEELNALKDRFFEMRQALLAHVGESEARKIASKSTTLADFIDLVDKMRKAGSEHTDEALKVIRDARLIGFRDDRASEALEAFGEKLTAIEEDIRAGSMVPRSFLSRKHPLSKFVRAVRRGGSIDKALARELSRELGHLCGEQAAQALLSNLLQGDLVLRSSIPAKKEVPADGVKKPQVTPRPEAEIILETTAAADERAKAPEKPVIPEPDRPEIPAVTPLTETPLFLSETGISVVARLVGAKDPANDGPGVETVQALVWHLIGAGRLSLAFHVAASLEVLHPSPNHALPSWLVKAVMLGSLLAPRSSAVTEQLKECFARYDEERFITDDKTWSQGVHVLLASASLLPALTAPETGACEVLAATKVGEGLDCLHKLIEAIVEYASSHKPLNLESVKKAREQLSWQEQVNGVTSRAGRWLDQAVHKSFPFAPARRVWKAWLEQGGLLYELLAPVKNNDTGHLAQVKLALQKIGDGAFLKETIRATDRKISERHGGGPIDGAPLAQLIKHAGEATDLASKWIGIHKAGQADRGGFFERALQLTEKLDTLCPEALAELDRFRHKPSVVSVAGAAVARRVIASLRDVLTGARPVPDQEVKPEILLHGELLKAPSVSMADTWKASYDPGTLIREIASLAGTRSTFAEAFSFRSRNREFGMMERIIEYLEQSPEPDTSVDVLRAEHERLLAESRERLREDARTTESRVAEALTLGVLPGKDGAALREVITTIEERVKTTTEFQKLHADLEAVRGTVEEKRARELARLRARLVKLQETDVVPVEKLLASGDIGTAGQYIELLEKGVSLPGQIEGQQILTEFFPSGLVDIEAGLSKEDLEPGAIRRTIRLKKSFAGVEMRLLPAATREQAGETLATWFEAKKRGKLSERAIRVILDYLGINVLDVDMNGTEKPIDITTTLIHDRKLWPVPPFGSAANGRYTILCAMEGFSERWLQGVFDALREGPNEATVILCFGRLDREARRAFARMNRRDRQTLLLIDDFAITHLARMPVPRLRALSSITLPFTFVQPYSTKLHDVPEEMFYGRLREREAILDPRGPCLVYGGHQLGKSALLHNVGRSIGSVEGGKIALLYDLKPRGIGYSNPPEAVWSLVGTGLCEVLPNEFRSYQGPSKLLESVTAWLGKDGSRRILILFDEADQFLDADRIKKFHRLNRIKETMDQTGGRFKVVFTALRNVFATQPDHPLAMYGKPLCLGPFVSPEEMQEARALIENPFASLGYRFESPDLVTKILSQTAGFPHLIQTYGRELIEWLTEQTEQRFAGKETPPYVITGQHLREAYEDRGLRERLAERFAQTLQSDPRYEVIAGTIGVGLEGNKGEIDLAQIRNDAQQWWSEGFREEGSEESFGRLLGEMVAMGVLSETENRGYQFRNGIDPLLGKAYDIIGKNREFPLEYDPAAYRTGHGPLRSPLTGEQESALATPGRNLTLLVGSTASGIDTLPLFVKESLSMGNCTWLEKDMDRRAFEALLNKAANASSKNKVPDMLFVPPVCNYDIPWMAEVLSRARAADAQDLPVNVVFCADPVKAWNLTAEGLDFLIYQGMSVMSLELWTDATVRQWLEDCRLGPNDRGSREEISRVTGNWPLLLQEFHRRSEDAPHLWRKALEDLHAMIGEPGAAEKLAGMFGLDLKPISLVLHVLEVMEGGTAEKVWLLKKEEMSRERVEKTLALAHLLRLVLSREGWYEVDPIVGRILKAITRAA